MLSSTTLFTTLSYLISFTSDYSNNFIVERLNNFTSFITKYDKSYDNIKSLTDAFNNYNINMDIIDHHDIGFYGYELGETQFMDVSSTTFGGYHKGLSSLATKTSTCQKFDRGNSSGSIPSEVDWRTKNVVTPVKDQAACGSCWSFSATGAIEGALAINNGELVSLSEQQLLDCSKDYGNWGCGGGLPDQAFEYVIDNGICLEDDVPYKAVEQTCKPCSTNDAVKINHCVDVTSLNQNDLKLAVSRGPVSVAIEADTSIFQLYKGGIISSDECGTYLDHAVLIVGYGTENDQMYWLVKNSWGEDWGEDGYLRILRSESDDDAGICGIAMQASYPVVV